MKTDLTGREIKVGNVIAFSKNNEQELSIGIVIEITDAKIHYLKKTRRAKYQVIKTKTKSKRKFLGYSDWTVRRTYLKLEKGELQARLVLIENPLFCLDNKNIAAQLEIMDMGIDQKILPEHYKLGEAIGPTIEEV